MTLQTQNVLKAFMDEPGRELYGLEVIAATRLATGTIYPILARLERYGWIEGRWEDPGISQQESRPPRRYYKITAAGAEGSRTAITKAYRARRQPVPGWLNRPTASGGAR